MTFIPLAVSIVVGIAWFFVSRSRVKSGKPDKIAGIAAWVGLAFSIVAGGLAFARFLFEGDVAFWLGVTAVAVSILALLFSTVRGVAQAHGEPLTDQGRMNWNGWIVFGLFALSALATLGSAYVVLVH